MAARRFESMKPRLSRVWLAGGALLVSDGAAHAAVQTAVLDSLVRCTSCRIEIGAPIPLRGSFEFGSLLSEAARVHRDEDGWIHVVYWQEPVIHVHRPDGTPAGRRIGRRGQGPGEFARINSLQIEGRTGHVYDALQGRWTVVDMNTGAATRTAPLPRGNRMAVLGDGRAVVSGPVALRETAGHPLHVFGPDGVWQGSFGLHEPTLRPDLTVLLWRWLHPVGTTMFWAAPMNEYRVELWDADGRLLRTLVGERQWFPPWYSAEANSGSRDRPPAGGVGIDRWWR
jgi:hypothetical protein